MWHKGQKLVCVTPFVGVVVKGPDKGRREMNKPALDEVYTYDGHNPFFKDFILLTELPHSWIENKFVPLSDWQEATHAVNEMLQEICQTV